MAPYLGGRGQIGPLAESPQNALSANRPVTIFLQHSKLRLSYFALCAKVHVLTFDGFWGVASCRKGPFILGSSLKQDCLLQSSTNLDGSSCQVAAHLGSIKEAASENAHENTAILCPSCKASQNGGNIAHLDKGFLLPQTSDNKVVENNIRPSMAVVMCLERLELNDYHLKKCLRHAGSVNVEEIMSLMKTLSVYGFQRSDVKAMLSKCPSLVQVSASNASQCLQYFLGLGFPKNVVISLLLKRPSLISHKIKRAGEVIDFFLSIGVSKEDLIVMLACRPHVVELDLQAVQGIINALLGENFDRSDISRLMKKAPIVFNLRIDNIENSISFWCNVVGVGTKDLFRAILRRPNLLSYNVQSMLHTHRYLQSWINPADLRKSICRFAELLSYNPQTKLKPTIDYFLEFGISEREVAKVIYRRPQIMSCTIERLERVTSFLRDLGLEDRAIGKVLLASPQVFTLNTEDKLKRGVEFFQSIGLDKERDMEFVFTRCAQIFCCSIEKNLAPTFEFLLNLGLEKESLLKMIAGFPSILGHNAKLSLAPKYDFLMSEMKRTDKELVDFPQYFGYSLEGRIKPRHKLLTERGLCTSLASMLACTDKDFHRRYLEPYSQFSEESTFFEMVDAVQQRLVENNIPRKKNGLDPSRLGRFKPRRQELSPVEGQIDHNQQKQSLLEPQQKVLAECPMHDNWDFLDMMPVLNEKQEPLYPAHFSRLFKTLTPCGIWIHAYKSDM